MRFILSIMMISVLAVLIACQSSAAPTSIKPIAKATAQTPATSADGHDHNADEEAARISLEEAKKAFDTNDALFVDTRYADAFKLEHVKGAINIPANEFDNRLNEIPKGKKIIAYCS